MASRDKPRKTRLSSSDMRSLASSESGRPSIGGAIPGFFHREPRRAGESRKSFDWVAVLAVLGQPVSPCKRVKCKVILPNCRDNPFYNSKKAFASQWVDRALPTSRSRENHRSMQGKVGFSMRLAPPPEDVGSNQGLEATYTERGSTTTERPGNRSKSGACNTDD